METNPELSVIIPVYNVEKYIAQTVGSIINQTYKDLEIICVDDRGSDGSMDIVRDFAAKDGRVKIIKHEKNKGLGAARNTALRHAKGKYVCFLDSDDYFYPSAIEKAVEALSQNACDSVWMRIISYFEEENRYGTEDYYTILEKHPQGYLEISPENINSFPAFTLNKVFSLDSIRRNNILFPEGLIYEDNSFYYDFYARSGRVYIIPERLCVYRRRKGSIMNDTEAGLAKREDICAVIKDIYCRLQNAGLFEKYKTAMLNLFFRNLEHSIKQPVYRQRLIKAVKLALAEIDFPQAYEAQKNNAYFFLLGILKYDESKKIGNFLRKFFIKSAAALTNLIPVRSKRKNLRRKIKCRLF